MNRDGNNHKKGSLRILFTCVGRRVELVQAFQTAAYDLDVKLEVLGTDISYNAPALAFCNKTYQICRISDEAYIPSLLSICATEKVDLVIPTIDTDLLLLSKRKREFLKNGTQVLISDEDKIAICRDKRKTAQFFLECGVNSPLPVDDFNDYKGGYPCFIKPKDGSSSINAYKINSFQELRDKSVYVPDYIIQPFISGVEYTVDIFCDFNHKPIYISPRKRLLVRSGEVLSTQIDRDVQLMDECKTIVSKFSPIGPLTVQIIRDATGVDYFIEINPRFGGGCPLSMKSGMNSAKAIIALMSNQDVPLPNYSLDKIVFSRFDQSISIQPKKPIFEISSFQELERIVSRLSVKAIVFDLDDTLFPELEYVKSGFRALCSLEPFLKDSYNRFLINFEEGKAPIDSVLKELGLYSNELRDRLLETYRLHIPAISLNPYAKEFLISWSSIPGNKLGMITDGRPNGQNNKIDSLGIRSFFDEIIITDELAGKTGKVERFRKPNSIAFEIMRNRLSTEYFDMVYIGDNLKKDFIAPQRLGMHCIRYIPTEGIWN